MEAEIKKDYSFTPFEIVLKIDKLEDLKEAIDAFGQCHSGNTYKVWMELKQIWDKV